MSAPPEGTEVLFGTWPAQLRCRRLPTPATSAAAPRIVLIHGGSHTGDCWIARPDGRAGWAPIFASRECDVHIVDYLDIGREYPVLERTVGQVLDALVELLEQIGPSTVIGHSLGGGLALKLTERAPDLIEATVLAAPAAVEHRNPAVAQIDPGHLVRLPRDTATTLLANSPRFPSSHLDVWFSGLVPYGPYLRNAGAGVTDELKVDPSRVQVWRRVPTLMLLAELDRTVTVDAGAATATAMGVAPVLLGTDWHLPDHAHMFIVERGTEMIAEKVHGWLRRRPGPLPQVAT